VLVKALQRHNPPPEGAPIGVKADRAQEDYHAIRNRRRGHSAAKAATGGKVWRTLVLAAVAAVAIAAGVGYASYEYKKASREEEAKALPAEPLPSARCSRSR
jgi:hypothetical protein